MAAALAGVSAGAHHASAQLTWDPLANTAGSDGNGTWSAATGTNWASGGTDGLWINGSSAVIGAGGSGTYNITVGTPIVATSVTFNAGANYNLSGSLSNGFNIGGGTINFSTNVSLASFNLSGTGGLTFNGATGKILTLSGSGSNQDSLTGPITIAGGTLNVNYSGITGFTTPFATQQVIQVNSGATLIEAQGNSIGSAYGPAIVNVSSGGVYTMNGGSYSAVVNLTGGTFNTTNGSSYNQYYNEGNGQGITTFASSTTSIIAVPMNSGYTNTPFNISLGSTSSGIDAIYSGSMSGGYSLTKSFAGALEVTGVSTDTGTATVNQGTLVVAVGAAIGASTAPVAVNANSATGASVLNFSSGATIGALSGTLTGSGASATINVAGTLTSSQTTTSSYAGNLNVTGGLTMSSYGLLTLAGTSTFGGALTLNSGKIAFGTSGASVPGVTFTGTTLNAGESFVTGYVNGSSTLALGAITRVTGSTLDFTLPNSGGSITTTTSNAANGIMGGWATIGGGSSWAVSSGSAGSPGAISALTSSSSSYGNNYASTTSTTDFNPSGTGQFNNSSVNSLQFTNSAATTTTVPYGFVITSGGILNSPSVGSNASIIAGGSITSGASELFVNQYNTTTLSISASIINNGSGSMALTKSGSGTLTLSGINTYSGGTYLMGGGVVLQTPGALGSGALTVGAAVFTATGDSSTNSAFLDLSGLTGPVTTANNIVLPAPTGTTYYTIVIPSGVVSPQTLAGVISGGSSSANIELNTSASGDYAGTYILTGTNTFTGNWYLNRGSVEFGSDAALGPDSDGITLGTNPGTTETFLAPMTFGHAITDIQQAFFDTQTNAVTLSGAITNSSGGNITKVGTGTLTLSGSDGSYLAPLTVDNGTVILGTSNTLGTPTLNLSGGIFATPASRSASETLTKTTLLTGASGVSAGNFSLASYNLSLGAITRNVGSTLNFATLPTTGSIQTNKSNTATTILGGWATVGGNTWAISAGNGSAIGAISGLSVFGTSYTGAATATDFDAQASGTFTPTGLNSLRFNTVAPITTTLNGAFVIASGGILESAAVGNNADIITGGTSITSGNGTDLIISQFNPSNTLTIATPIANNGSTPISLTVSGPGTVVLGATNTFNGSSYVNNAVLSVSSDGNFGLVPSAATAGNLVLTGGTILPTSSFTLNTNRGITLAADVNTFNVPGGVTLSYGGVITGANTNTTLVKNGTGTLNLSGLSLYAGGTIVNAGTVNLSGGYGTGTLRGPLTINSGGTVTATGFTDLGQNGNGTNPMTINTGGVFNTTTGSPVSFTTNFILNGGTINGTAGICFGSSSYSITSLANSTTATISSPVEGYGTITLPFNVGLGTTPTGIDLLVSGNINIYSGTLGIVKNGPGTMAITGSASYTLGTTINAGTLQIGLGTLGNDGKIAGSILNNSVLSFNVGANETYSNNISGAGAVNSNSAAGAAVTLSGTNSYSGPTTVAGGTLTASGTFSGNGPFKINSGATLNLTGTFTGTGPIAVASTATLAGTATYPGVANVSSGGIITAGQNSGGTLTLGGMSLGSSATLNFGTLANYASTPAINVTGTGLFDPGTSTHGVTINVASLTGAPAGTYELIQYNGANADNAVLTPYTLTPLAGRTTGSLNDVYNAATGVGMIDLTIGASGSAYVIWTGQTNSSWDGTTVNWNLSTGGTTTFQTGDQLVFNDNPATSAVTIGSYNVSPSSMTFNNNVSNYAFSGAYGIGGSANGITLNGLATVTIATSNTFTGPVAVNAGVLNLQNSGALGVSSGVTVASGATLQLQGGVSVGVGVPLTLGGSGALNQSGSLVSVSGNNTYSGPLSFSGSTTLSVLAGSLNLSNPSVITGGASVLTLSSGTGAVGTLNGAMNAGTGTVVVTGTGTWTLTGTNANTGPTNVNSGTLVVTNRVPASGNYATTNSQIYNLAAGATLNLNYSTGSYPNYDGVNITGSGVNASTGLYLAAGVTQWLDSGLNISTAPTTVRTTGSGTATIEGWENNTLIKVPAAASGSVIASTVNVAATDYGATLNITAGANTATGDLTINGSMPGSANNQSVVDGVSKMDFSITGGGSLLLNGTGSYSDGFWIQSGSLILGANNRLPTANAVLLGYNTGYGELVLNGYNQTVGNLTAFSTSAIASNIVINGTATPSVLTVNYNTSGGTDTFAGTLGGANANQNNFSLVLPGAGNFVLTAVNNYSGGTTVTAGTLTGNTGSFGTGSLLINPNRSTGTSVDAVIVNTTNSLGLNSAVTVNTTSPTAIGTLNFNGNVEPIGSLAGTGNVVLNNGGGTALSIGTNNFNTTFSGNITDVSGSGSLTKMGTGVLTLSGSNSWGGPTNVSAGTLVITQTSALPTHGNNSSMLVSKGAVLVLDSQTTESNIPSLNMNGTMIVHGGNLATIDTAVGAAYNNAWAGTGSGIYSSAAATDSTYLTALGVIQNDNGFYTGTRLNSTYEGQSVSDSDILVKYTYYGDTNLDGKVDGSDYSRVDNAFGMENVSNGIVTTPVSGWFNGDFNYDGIVDGSDYTLMDNAFNNQGAQFTATIATPTALLGGGGASGGSAVPEPATLSLLCMGAVGLLGRRARRQRGR